MTAIGERLFVDVAEIAAQQDIGWPDFHPEDYCHRCGGRNIYSWHAPNDIWNEAVPAEFGIVCPQCFTELARAVGHEPSVWVLVNGDPPAADIPAAEVGDTDRGKIISAEVGDGTRDTASSP